MTEGGPLPDGIEHVISKASVDLRFRRALLRDRVLAIAEADVELTPAERSILLSVPDEHLRLMVGEVALATPPRRRILLWAASLCGLALAGGSGVAYRRGRARARMVTTGSRPDYAERQMRAVARLYAPEDDPATETASSGPRPDQDGTASE